MKIEDLSHGNRRGVKGRTGKSSTPKGKAKAGKVRRHYSARQLVDLLLTKHSDAVAVPECKIGPSYAGAGQSTRRFDVWVMVKSWASPRFIGYEIKVTRSDFLRDEKWREYLPFCSEFSFVCPPGVIEKEEVPEEAGLIVCTSNATRLYTKKKAPHRVIEIPESVIRYVLMSRARIVRDYWRPDNVEKWKKWLREKDEKKKLGEASSFKLRKLVDERIAEAEAEVKKMKREVEKFAEVKRWAKRNDVHLGSTWNLTTTLNRRLEEAERGFTGQTVSSIREAIEALERVRRIIRGEEGPRERRDMGRLRMKDGEERPEVELGRTVNVPTVRVEEKRKSS